MTERESAEHAAGTAPLSCAEVEGAICELWRGHFGREVSPYDDFYDLGGDSIGMIDIVVAARERGLPVKSSQALRNPTPARLAESLTLPGPASADRERTRGLEALCASADADPAVRSPGWCADDTRPVPIVETGVGEPLYVVHSDNHGKAEREAVRSWGIARPAWGFLLPGAKGPIPPYESVGEAADRYLAVLRVEQPHGPYRLAGFGIGATLAFELARRLRADDQNVAVVALIDPVDPDAETPATERANRDSLLRQRLALLAGRFGLSGAEDLAGIHARVRQAGWYDDALRPADLPRLQLAWAQWAAAARAYRIADYDGRVVLVHDGLPTDAGERTWYQALTPAVVHRLDHGLESPLAVITDTGVARTMRKVLEE